MLPRLLLLLALAAALPAAAHTTKLSSAEITLSDREVDVVLLLNGTDLSAALSTKLTGEDGRVTETMLLQAADAVSNYVTKHAYIASSRSCSPQLRRIAAEAEHVRIAIHWICPPITGELTYQSLLFSEIDPTSRQVVMVKGDASWMALLSVASPRVVLASTRVSNAQVFGQYLLAGIEHIAIGYDHIAFLIAVILWGRRLWPLVGVVTAFTLAHSVTLSLAVLGVLTPPARLVELLIALSIVYVGAENFFVRDLRRRWVVTFVFGLVHGFGFASVLREYGIPQDALVPALAAFNIGVELGQIAIVVLALSALRAIEARFALFQPAPSVRLVYPISGAVLLLGLAWSGARLFAA